MKKTSGSPGVVSYAGLDKAKLISQAEAAFCRRDTDVPARFATLLPLFPAELVQDMRYIGVDAAHPGRATAEGFALSISDYHRRMYQQEPSLYTGDNLCRCIDREGRFTGRGVVTIDREWAQRFPQYQQFMGEKLMLHVIGGGAQAVAVPESLHPRGGGLLTKQEKEMGIAAAAKLYAQYAALRVRQGEKYDGPAFAADYVQAAGLRPVALTQSELGRILQEIGICQSVEKGEEAQLYTENSRRVEGVRQYVRMLAACDVFEPATVSKSTARLAQLYFDGDDFISDLWMPYGELLSYVDRERAAVSAAALCEGCQIAPRYDAVGGCGRYPDRIRMVTVVDRDLRLMTSDVLNNPAYGSGMNPLGMIAKQVSLPRSGELLARGQLREERCPFTVENTEVPLRIFLEQLALARLQEHKGRLIDAMVRREAALSQLKEGESRRRAAEQLSRRVERLEQTVREETARHTLGQMSGYDADIDYLRKRFAAWQEGGEYPLDTQRQASIECGYVLRGAYERADYDALHVALPDEAEEDESRAGAESAGVEDASVERASAESGETMLDGAGAEGASVERGETTLDGAGAEGASVEGASVESASAESGETTLDGAGVEGAGVEGAGVESAGAEGASAEGGETMLDGASAEGASTDRDAAAQSVSVEDAKGSAPSSAAQGAEASVESNVTKGADSTETTKLSKPKNSGKSASKKKAQGGDIAQAADETAGDSTQSKAAAKPAKPHKSKASKGQRIHAEQITFDLLPEPAGQQSTGAAPALDELARHAEPPMPRVANKQGAMATLTQDQPATPPRKPQNMQELLQQLLSK